MNEKLFNPDYLENLCRKYGLRPSKKYGQNYLIDPGPVEAMIAAGEVNSQDTVVEVGPGFGVLTFALLEKAGSVVAFEIEKKLEQYWEGVRNKEQGTSTLEIIWGNVMRTGEEAIGDRRYKLISNLPYQITSQIIRLFLESQNPPERMVLMVQKEVAERICAKPASPDRRVGGDMSVLSVAVQYYADAEIVMQVPRTMFWPVPAVDSAVIMIKNKEKRIKNNEFDKRFFQIVKIGFANRRKLLYKNLLPWMGKKNSDSLKSAFSDLSLDPARARAQELSVDKWKKMAQLLDNLKS